MKTKKTFKKITTNILILLFLVTGITLGTAQESKSTDKASEDFKIIFKKTENGVEMHSLQGCAWIDLSFSLYDSQTNVIDEYGMTKSQKDTSKKDPNLTNFKFTITRTKNTITLKSIEGTFWKELTFSLNKNDKQIVDKSGVRTYS